MSLLKPLARLARSSVGAIFAPAEDPRTGFAHAYQQQRALLAKVRLALDELRESRQRLEGRRSRLLEQLSVLDEQARSALLAGQEPGARAVLRRRAAAELHAAALADQASELSGEEQALLLIEQRLTTQIDSFYTRQQVLAARFSAAEAQVRINEALAGLTGELTDMGLALEQAEESTVAMRARSDAVESLLASGVLEHMSSAEPANGDFEAQVEARLSAIAADLRRPTP